MQELIDKRSVAPMMRARAMYCALNESETDQSGGATKSEKDGLVAELYSAAEEAHRKLDDGEPGEQVLSFLLSAWVGALTVSAISSFRKGLALRTVSTPRSDRELLKAYPRLKKAIVDQSKFLRGFAEDHLQGVPSKKGRMSFLNRSILYGQSVKGYYNLGALMGSKPKDLVYWRLGECEHCSDCVAIAASGPYFAEDLPTVPGMGHTKCGHWCCCSLSIRPGVESIFAPSTFGLGPLVAAGDLRAPTKMEAVEISDLRLREAFAARRVSEGDVADLEPVVRARDELRSKIDDTLIRLQVFLPETLALGGVISGLLAGTPDFDDQFDDNSIDGGTLSRVSMSDLTDIIDEFVSESLEVLSDV